MSGVFAAIARGGKPVPAELARVQLAAIAGRGDRPPRLWQGPGIALGHANFPTTPEAERELLPVADASGRFRITWDGRLDNRSALAAVLVLDTAAARAMTDAEYVLAAYQRWGDRCVDQLLGDWALIIWDGQRRRLFCAKDPLGWRQLYYAEAGSLLLIGSEPRQLFAGGAVAPTPNDDYLRRYLAGAMQQPGATCWSSVRELEGGQTLVAGESGVTIRSYWRYPEATPRRYRRVEEYVDEFLAVTREATRVRLRSNRPVGISLSGGLDSSYVAALAADQGERPHALTAFAPGTRWLDERPWARSVVEFLGLKQTELDISDCWALSSRWLDGSAFDQPDQPPQAPHMLARARAARAAGLSVLLTGDGGDEWIRGNEHGAADALLRGRPWVAARLLTAGVPPAARLGHAARTLYRSAVPPAAQGALQHLRGHPRWSELLPLVPSDPSWVSTSHYEETEAWRPRLAREREWQVYRAMVRPVVGWQDRQALARHQIEHRAPLNDLRVIELMASTPEWVKQHRGRTKDILRVAGHRLMPLPLWERPDKAVFNELVDAGLQQHERQRITTAAAHLTALPYLDRNEVERAMQALDQSNAARYWWQPAWRLASAALWLQQIHSPSSAGPISRIDWDTRPPVDGALKFGRKEVMA